MTITRITMTGMIIRLCTVMRIKTQFRMITIPTRLLCEVFVYLNKTSVAVRTTPRLLSHQFQFERYFPSLSSALVSFIIVESQEIPSLSVLLLVVVVVEGRADCFINVLGKWQECHYRPGTTGRAPPQWFYDG